MVRILGLQCKYASCLQCSPLALLVGHEAYVPQYMYMGAGLVLQVLSGP